ncbi:hypothetical protein [Tunturiibacter gelidiferens]|uniref:hypothetical protein n=1 Tax=Tunturiibacter gelidiferens TaxID=3069689 RepID=UPI003D9B3AB1
MKTLPQPWTVAMEATIFSGWIYDHLLPHATQIKVAHPSMLRANGWQKYLYAERHVRKQTGDTQCQ